MDLHSATNQILFIRKRLKRLKNIKTIEIYKNAEKYIQRKIILNNGMYVNSKDKTININDVNPKHLHNIVKKYN